MLSQKHAVRLAQIVLLICVGFALGCGEEEVGPTTADFTQQREALKARVANKRQESSGKVARSQASAPAQAGVDMDLSAPTFAATGSHYVYDPVGKRDPFRNFMWERPDRLREAELEGPLEQFDLMQLALIAVVWKTGSARALVQDPSGESYIVGEGSRIGRNEGRVISIDDGVVVVKETYVDYLGQETTKDIEMRMRRNEGG